MSSPFNQRDFYGRNCLWAFFPHYSNLSLRDADASNPLVQNAFFGQKLQTEGFLVDSFGGGSTKDLYVTGGDYEHLTGMRAMRFNPDSHAQAYRLANTSTEGEGIVFPDKQNWTIVSIFKPVGIGGNGDTRIIDKDQGGPADDHDFMLGMSSNGSVRARIRTGVTVGTILAGTVQSDALNISSIGMQPSEWSASLLRQDGTYARTTSSDSNPYLPRTTTATYIGANGGQDQGGLDGDILCIMAFNTYVGYEENLQQLLQRPWRVLKPQKVLVPMTAAAPVAPAEPDAPSGSLITSLKAIARGLYRGVFRGR